MISNNILLVLALVVLVGPLAWLAGRWLVAGAVEARKRLMKAARARTRATVENNSGDWPVPMTEKRQAEIRNEWQGNLADIIDGKTK